MGGGEASIGGLTGSQWASLGTNLVGGVMSSIGQSQAAEAQLEAQRQQMQAIANQTYENQVAARKQQSLENEQLARQKLAGVKKLKQDKATAITIAGESGVSGASIDAYIDTFNQALSEYTESVSRQQQLNQWYYDDSIKNMTRSGQAQINAVRKPVYDKSFSTLTGSLVGAMDQYQTYKAQNTRGLS